MINTLVNGTALKPTVLVVDDEAGPRNALTVILRPFFNIHTAENAKAALDLLKSQPIDLITLDQKLPDQHGMDLLQDIKHDYADVEVVIITGYGSLKSALEGIRYGAAGYLLKPFNVTELITLIQQTLEKKKRLDFIRNFFTAMPGLWGSEPENTLAWESFRTGYYACGGQPNGNASPHAEGEDLIPLLSDLLEAKDKQLLNHSSRVSYYATLLGNRLHLPLDMQKSLTMGAFLHDIGKITLASYKYADDINAPVDADECSNAHADRGTRLLQPLAFPAEVGQAVAYHHERWDGLGYPHGLQGEGIPLLARIVSIAQQFDHLTAEVPGHKSLSIDEALQRLSLEAHTRFDPKLCEQFITVVNECKASLPPMALAATPAHPLAP